VLTDRQTLRHRNRRHRDGKMMETARTIYVKPRSHCPIRLKSAQMVESRRIGQCDQSYDPIQLNSTGSSISDHFGFLSS
jgi:hypothetical protein